MGGLVRKRTRSECESFTLPVKKSRPAAEENNAAAATPVKRSKVIEHKVVAPAPVKRGRSVAGLKNVEVARDLAASSDYVIADNEVTLKVPDAAKEKENLPPMATAVGMHRRVTENCVEAAEKEEEVDERETNRRSPNGFLLPDPLPKGERLVDSSKQEWVLGKPIGLGGFGELYLASRRSDGKLSPENYVIKIEPHSNGPLFVEVHFYIRATRQHDIKAFKTKHNLKHLGVPSYIGSGTHRRQGKKFRFLVMDRFGSDLQRILDHSEGGRFTDKTVCEVGMQVLDSLQYIHKQGYVHKDVKAANLLVGLGMNGQHKVHLVDFGLCSTFKTGSIHKQYIHDERWAHEGTLEYTSRDSHIGCTSRRGDVEVLVYNLVEWWGGSLPWDRDIANPNSVKVAKFRAFNNPHKFLRHCFRRNGCNYPQILNKMMQYIANLRFEQEPDYNYLKGLFRQQMRIFGCVPDGRLEFRLGVACPPLETEAENLEYLKPLEPDARVSGVFDRLCVSTRSWEASREEMIARRDEEALANPTPAMRDIMNKMREKAKANARSEGGGGRRHRKKSASCMFEERQENTPAMLEVIRARQLRLLKEEAEKNNNSPSCCTAPQTTLPARHMQVNLKNGGNLQRSKSVIFTTTAQPPQKGIDVARVMTTQADESLRSSVEQLNLKDKLDEIEKSDAEDPSKARLIPRDLLGGNMSPIPAEVVEPVLSGRLSPQQAKSAARVIMTRRKHSLDTDFDMSAAKENAGLAIDLRRGGGGGGGERLRRGRGELSRLDIFLPPPSQNGSTSAFGAGNGYHIRTRSANAVDDWMAVRTLRSAFKDGVSKLIRQVSDSFTNIF